MIVSKVSRSDASYITVVAKLTLKVAVGEEVTLSLLLANANAA